ncbi:hypothetical protein [Chryseobacterium pennae]|uniref:hypothetical protein n=1 Tax=Chryseobacterium pennae TaxID=2258962 RepID=UPI000F511CE8|nr:hypothetical protein [Chryseobacterium pennae]
MIENLEYIYSILFPLLPFSLVTAFLGFIIVLVSNVVQSLQKNYQKLRLIGIFLLTQVFIVAIILIALQTIILKNIQNEFIETIKKSNTEMTQSDYTFGTFYNQALKAELLKIKDIQPHHSGTSRIMKVRMKIGNETSNIRIEQDSQNKNEFWIFWDKYWFGNGDEEVGRFYSNTFH